MNIDFIVANGNTGTIWQGDRYCSLTLGSRFDVVVCCESDFQPPNGYYGPNTKIVYAPNHDDKLSPQAIQIATRAGREIAYAYSQGRKILVICHEGRNRSGLVTALGLHMFYGITGKRAADIVIRRRISSKDPALTNPYFMEYLNKLPKRETRYIEKVVQRRIVA